MGAVNTLMLYKCSYFLCVVYHWFQLCTSACMKVGAGPLTIKSMQSMQYTLKNLSWCDWKTLQWSMHDYQALYQSNNHVAFSLQQNFFFQFPSIFAVEVMLTSHIGQNYLKGLYMCVAKAHTFFPTILPMLNTQGLPGYCKVSCNFVLVLVIQCSRLQKLCDLVRIIQ